MSSSFDLDTFNARYGGVIISKYERGQIVYAQGSAASSTFYVLDGSIQLTVVSEQGKERVIGVLHANEFCGEGCLSNQLLRVSSAAAMTDSAIARLEKASVLRALHEDVDFSELFVSYLLRRNIRLTDDLVDQLFNSTERRLARVLLLMADLENRDRQDVPIAPVSQETLAKMVGATRSRINVFMNKFRRLGYIEYKGRINVHQSLWNVVLRGSSREDAA